MNDSFRRPVTIGTAILGVTAVQLADARSAHACLTRVEIPTYVAGHFNSVNAGDMGGIAVSPSSTIGPIIEAIGENIEHVFHIDTSTGNIVSENIANVSQIPQGFDCTHPANYNYMAPAPPGIMYNVPADGNTAYTTTANGDPRVVMGTATVSTPAGVYWAGGSTNIVLIPTTYVNGSTGSYYVVHNQSAAACTVTTLYSGSGSNGGYHFYAFSHYPGAGQNGMCVDFMNSYCGVTRPAPGSYSLTEALNATNAMYNEVYNDCKAGISWVDNFLCSGACDHVSDQFVNTFWYNNPMDTAEYNFTTGAPMVTAINTIVTPYKEMHGFPNNPPAPLTATIQTVTYTMGKVNVPGACP